MKEPGRRPLLQLKTPPTPKPAPPAMWKCKPCGTTISVPEGADEDWVRCPGCNARLGRLGDFRSDPPLLAKLRARPAPASAAKAETPVATGGPPQVWRRRAGTGGLKREPKSPKAD